MRSRPECHPECSEGHALHRKSRSLASLGMTGALGMTLVAAAGQLAAQRAPVDTNHTLNPVIVTADRARTPLSGSIASVTRLSSAELAKTPRATLADLLRRAPGFTVIDFDGL